MFRTCLVCTGAIAAAMLAQASGAAGERRGPSGNPNKMVCVTETGVGSRLARRRVCRTRSEWEQHQSEYKQEVERAQQQMQSHLIDPEPPARAPQR